MTEIIRHYYAISVFSERLRLAFGGQDLYLSSPTYLQVAENYA